MIVHRSHRPQGIFSILHQGWFLLFTVIIRGHRQSISRLIETILSSHHRLKLCGPFRWTCFCFEFEVYPCYPAYADLITIASLCERLIKLMISMFTTWLTSAFQSHIWKIWLWDPTIAYHRKQLIHCAQTYNLKMCTTKSKLLSETDQERAGWFRAKLVDLPTNRLKVPVKQRCELISEHPQGYPRIKVTINPDIPTAAWSSMLISARFFQI